MKFKMFQNMDIEEEQSVICKSSCNAASVSMTKAVKGVRMQFFLVSWHKSFWLKFVWTFKIFVISIGSRDIQHHHSPWLDLKTKLFIFPFLCANSFRSMEKGSKSYDFR